MDVLTDVDGVLGTIGRSISGGQLRGGGGRGGLGRRGLSGVRSGGVLLTAKSLALSLLLFALLTLGVGLGYRVGGGICGEGGGGDVGVGVREGLLRLFLLALLSFTLLLFLLSLPPHLLALHVDLSSHGGGGSRR